MSDIESALTYAKDLALMADCESDRMLVMLAGEVRRLTAEIERWRDSNRRFREEMEHQARECVRLREELNDLIEGRRAILPRTEEHARKLLTVAHFCLNQLPAVGQPGGLMPGNYGGG